LERRKTPMLVSFLAVGLNLLLNWVFTFRLGWGHRGLAFSTGCIATFNFLFLYLLMQHHLQGLESRRMLALLAKVGAACAALAAVCAAGSHWLLANWQEQSLLLKLTALLATITAGALAFSGCGVLLHIEELKELRDAVRRRAKLIISRRSG
jgi:putative peptidoglycan lipid II flippase